MIFSSLEFLLLFLPFTIFIYYTCIKYKFSQFAITFLFLASLFYYAYWNPSHIWVILASIFWNFSIGWLLSASSFVNMSTPSSTNKSIKILQNISTQFTKQRKFLFVLGILGNVGALLYYKYADFALSSLNSLIGTEYPTFSIMMPIGISFFTFQQIAYLSDIYTNKNDSTDKGFISYCLFICFFPQLVAGPIVHHKEMMPQFADENNKKINWENIYWGLILLSIGLAKKIIIADNISPLVIHTFEQSTNLTFMEAFVASIAYTFQLYFDFSGYSDMAVGCALFFNIHLPFNFYSPYKSINIQDFWRRWHITLSRWLKEYIYIPLGGNKKGNKRTLVNLFLTFLLGGIWHGAAWTFVAWGALHGFAILLHRVWAKAGKKIPTIPAIIVTFLFVNITWILFRAPDFERVNVFLDGFMFDNGFWFRREFFKIIHDRSWAILGFAAILVFVAKNSQELYVKNKPSAMLSVYSVTLFLCSIAWLAILLINFPDAKAEFIYFQF